MIRLTMTLLLLVAVAGLFGCATPSSQVQTQTDLISSGPPPMGVEVTRTPSSSGVPYTTVFQKDGTLKSWVPSKEGCGTGWPCQDTGKWWLSQSGEKKVFCVQYTNWQQGRTMCGQWRVGPPEETVSR